MDIYLTDTATNERFHFPVNPEEITVEGAKKIETVSIVNIGDIDFPEGDERTGISFSSFFPKEYDSSYCRYSDIPNPHAAMAKLQSWRIAGKPIRLLITQSYVNVLALLTQTSHRYVGGEPGDIYFDLSFKQWREVKVRTTAETVGASTANDQKSRTDTKPVPKSYTVKSGDSLYKIAKLELGDGAKWQSIYDKNKSIIGPDPNVIKPGQKLVMP